MKLNNKGFALTSIIYMLIVLFLMVMLLILANLAQRKVVLDKIKNDVKENLNQGGVVASSNMIVTFDPQGGQINQTSKQVTYNEPYGELPTPTREGYTFLGWRGKNLIDMQEWLNMTTRATNGTITKTQSSITLTATNNDAYTVSTYRKSVEPNKTYTLSWNSTQASTNTNDAGLVYVFINGKQTSGYLFNANTVNTKKITFTTPEDAKYITFRVGVSYANNTITYSDIQLEEGNTATEYEIYQKYTKDTIVTTQENHTVYATWENQYTIIYNGNGATSGTTSSSIHTYGEPQKLTPNGYEKTGYKFAGWSTDQNTEMTNILNDNNQYNYNNENGSTFVNLKSYTINPPFVAGENYQLFVEVKGIGQITNYFHGPTGYLQVAQTKTSQGNNHISGDGSNNATLTDEYTKYSAHFKLGSNGDGTKNKLLLFRIFEGSSAYIKNIRLYKTTSDAIVFDNEQTVQNLSTTPGDTITLYAIWEPNE